MSHSDETAFWQGEFGNEYSARNTISPEALRRRTAMWCQVLEPIRQAPPASILEVGCNIGVNFAALRQVSDAVLHGVEPNATARQILKGSGLVNPANVHAGVGQVLPFADGSIDMVFTSGVLIHVAPSDLDAVCREMLRVARRYIACIEYFADTPEEKLYRGHANKLFKRDFGSLWLDLAPELRLLDYGFFWKRVTGLDNLTWWLFEKPSHRV